MKFPLLESLQNILYMLEPYSDEELEMLENNSKFKVFINDLDLYIYNTDSILINVYPLSFFYKYIKCTVDNIDHTINYNYDLLLIALHLPINSFIRDNRTSIK